MSLVVFCLCGIGTILSGAGGLALFICVMDVLVAL